MAYDNVEVSAVSELGRQASALSQTPRKFEVIVGRAKRHANEAVAECASVVAQRTKELSDCEAQEDVDCSGCRQRLQTALAVQRTVQRSASELVERLGNLSRRLESDVDAGASWMRRMLGGLDAVGSPSSAGTGGPAATGGGVSSEGSAPSVAGGSKGAFGDGRSGGGSSAGSLPFGDGLTRVSLAKLDLDPDLFEKEPPDGVAKADMIWAAQTFKDVVLPHAARGGTQEQLTAIDAANGRHSGLDRLAGVWDVYLGSDATSINVDSGDNVTSINGGRHRALAAQMVGLTWVPGRVHPHD